MNFERFRAMFNPVISQTVEALFKSDSNQLFDFELTFLGEKQFDILTSTHIFNSEIKHVTTEFSIDKSVRIIL